MSTKNGFTLVEIMIALGLIAIIAAFLIPNFNQGSAQSRDAERQAAVRTVQNALELYKNKYGRYPVGCNDGPANNNASWRGYWSGEPGSDWACPGDSAEYIIDLAPEFIPRLPRDPFTDGRTDRSYVYTTNPAGTVYKFMSMNGAESETLTYDDTFVRCGDMNLGDENECTRVPGDPTGTQAYNTVGSTPSQCNTASIYQDDYATWGGYAPGGFYNIWRGDSGNPAADARAREYFSDQIRCK